LLRHVVVDPSMKRRGIGSFLITAGDNALLAAGYRELDLVVTDTNEAVVTLYIKLEVRVLERLREPPAADQLPLARSPRIIRFATSRRKARAVPAVPVRGERLRS
jgi:ribosomal protein S18 acetylase RimI-like enzyme